MPPQLDGIISAIRGLTLVDEQDSLDFTFSELDPFSDDTGFWLGAEEGVEVPDPEFFGGQDFVGRARWMRDYQNGQIPVEAMAQIPGGGYLRPDAAAAFQAMYNAAKADGVIIDVGAHGAAYRDLETQVALYKEKGDYDKGGLAADPGTSPHGWGIAVDVGEGGEREWLEKNAHRFGFKTIPREPWHWEYTGGYTPTTRVKSGGGKARPPQAVLGTTGLVPSTLGLQGGSPALFPSVLTQLLLPEAQKRKVPVEAEDTSFDITPDFTGEHASIEEQLWLGFMDAGRPDLAAMVGTSDFDLWIGRESGWRVDVVSQYFPGHGRNDGLFQVWRGHAFNANGEVSQMSPYQQAMVIAEHFSHLEPADIERYADQVRADTYGGWG